MTDTKKWYQSKGFWGCVLGLVVIFAEAVGVAPIKDPSSTTLEWFAFASTLAGLIGRLVAQKRLTL